MTMSAPLFFTLKIPPTVNLWWRPVVVGPRLAKMILTDDAKLYKEEAYIVLAGQRNRTGAKPFDGPVSTTVTIYEARAGRDHDNYNKGIFDVLKGFAYHDDKQIRRHSVELIAPPAGQTKAAKAARAEWKPRVEVRVERIETEC